jgi:hypothetical protein
MRAALRWAILLGLVLVLFGLIAYARGTKHHRGDDVGSHGAAPVVAATV